MMIKKTDNVTILQASDDSAIIIKPIKVGDEIETTAGNFKIVDVHWSNDDNDYEAICIWTVYKNDGTIYDVTKCTMLFSDLEDYMQYNYTDEVRVHLVYERSVLDVITEHISKNKRS